MQTLTQIRQMLEESGLAPQRMFGQNFLADQNLLRKIVELADVNPEIPVLEVGPGTGSLTEELLDRARRVVAVEIDYGLHELLTRNLGRRANLTLLRADVLSGKHALSPEVLAALGPAAQLVSNLPYQIATPLVAQCLLDSWKAMAAGGAGLCRFERLTFTVQREVADRMAAKAGSGEYGPVSIVVSLLGRLTAGPMVPAEAFWPRPKVGSRILRIDLNADAAARIADAGLLMRLAALVFNQRRKQVGSILRHKTSDVPPDRMDAAMKAAAIESSVRAEEIGPEQFLILANSLAERPAGSAR